MKKRFVLLSDLHSHPWSAFAKGDGLHNSRLRQSLNILEASLIKAEEEAIPWVFAGDLVHTAGYALNTVMAGVTEILCDTRMLKRLWCGATTTPEVLVERSLPTKLSLPLSPVLSP